MNFQNVMFSAEGRISSKDYWLGILIIIAGNVIAGVFPFIGMLLSLLLIYCGVCVYGKRLHDAGKSAWLHLIPWAVSLAFVTLAWIMGGAAVIALAINADNMSEAQTAASVGGAILSFLAMIGLGFVVWIVYTIWVGSLASEPGENRFGSQPHVDQAPSVSGDVPPST